MITFYACQECKQKDRIECVYQLSTGRNEYWVCSKEDPPPCDCFDCEDHKGNTIPCDFSNHPPCSGCYGEVALPECDQSNSSSGGAGATGEIYALDDCVLHQGKTGAASTLCAANFELIYFDSSPSSLDLINGRSVYVKFNIPDYDLSLYSYAIRILDDLGNIIDEQHIADGLTNANLRDSREIGNDLAGVMKTEISFPQTNFSTTKTYSVELRKFDNSNSSWSTLLSNTFEIRNEDIEPTTNVASMERLFNFYLYKTPSYDLYNYSIGTSDNPLPDFQAAAKHVFEKANIRMNIVQKGTIGKSLVDPATDAVVLDESVFWDGSEIDFPKAFNEWAQRVYKAANNTSSSYNNISIGLEVFTFGSYSNINNPTLSTEPALLTKLKDFLNNNTTAGFTNSPLTISYKPGSTVSISLRSRTDDVAAAMSGVSAEKLSLITMLHEMGHLWSAPAIFNNPALSSCDDHNVYHNGTDKNNCRFLTACKSGSTLESYLKDQIANPRFCEGHLAIFANQLRTHIDP